jgi:hypothetical protein
MKQSLFFTLLISITFCTQLSAQNACGLQVTGVVSGVRCQGQSNGSIDVTITGGSGSYNVFWVSGSSIWHTQDITNLPAGNYTLYVQDAGNVNCSISQYFEVTEPDPLELSFLGKASYNGADLHCSNSNDGRVSVSVMGGTYPYQYTLDGSNYQGSNVFTNLAAGTYYATVKDNNGCMVTNNPASPLFKNDGWIVPPAVLVAPAPLVTDSIQVTPTSVLSSGAESYTIYLGYALQSLGLTAGNTTGGTGMYSYNWSPTTGLQNWDVASVLATPTVTTNYTVAITDVNGCTTSRSVTINVINVSASESGSGKKTYLCHNGTTISVANQAVKAHLDHGDFLGPCHNTLNSPMIIEENNPGVTALKIMPNPSHGRFSVSIGNAASITRIEIFNSAGALVDTRVVSPAANSLQSFNLSGNPAGLYYIRVSASGRSTLNKVILQ